ncbi:DUF732 domain-containing protein [Mycobacterium deserti]|uniref:DUF732 domain-containing protein n=1 Tax=Mycobacterium deserti TaxID=2978347 RepID=A0ABT2M7D8_9MYCO|nr:DUF732 domain-containing protein [Mycobacterium deserti]MCT7658178.1 DUF732 domain-containing protein [Mycobacterium deserti]
MIRHCIAVAMAVAGFAVFGGAASAHAQTDDERFVDAITKLGITAGPDTDIPALGQNVCSTLTDELAKNVNPVPVVRGVVASLQNSNLTREQAVGFMRTSVAVYCPQYARFTGR